MAGTNPTSPEDITGLIEHYDQARKPGFGIEIGQVVFTPVLNIERKPTIADAVRSNPHTHLNVDLKVRKLDEKLDFRGKPGRLPIAALNLGQTEEIVVSRAKKRPCVVLAKSDGIDVQTLPAGTQRNKALNSFDGSYLLAPIYSATTHDKARSFGPTMMARIKCLMYPEFVFLPQSGLIIKNESVMRLDRLYWSHLLGATEPENLFLTGEALGICWEQIAQLAGELVSTNYAEMRELLLSYLPTNCQAVQS